MYPKIEKAFRKFMTQVPRPDKPIEWIEYKDLDYRTDKISQPIPDKLHRIKTPGILYEGSFGGYYDPYFQDLYVYLCAKYKFPYYVWEFEICCPKYAITEFGTRRDKEFLEVVRYPLRPNFEKLMINTFVRMEKHINKDIYAAKKNDKQLVCENCGHKINGKTK